MDHAGCSRIRQAGINARDPKQKARNGLFVLGGSYISGVEGVAGEIEYSMTLPLSECVQ